MENTLSQSQQTPFELNSKYLLPIMMLYLMATLAADVVNFKFIMIGPLLESGATLIFPITYLLGDIVTEVYGYHIARKFIWLNLLCELIFAFIVFAVIHVQSATGIAYQNDITHALGNILRFVLAGIIANIVSDFLNVYLISKWKIFMKGKHFWLRSLGSTAVSELFLNIITGMLAFFGSMNIMHLFHLITSAYLLEIFYAIVFVWPGWMIIIYLKKKEQIDVYDYNTNYNPFHY